jgi:hypothetical protein
MVTAKGIIMVRLVKIIEEPAFVTSGAFVEEEG